MTGWRSAQSASSIATTFCQFPCLALGMDLGLDFQDFLIQKWQSTVNQSKIKSSQLKDYTKWLPHLSLILIILSLSEVSIKKKHSSPALHIQDWKNDHSAPLLHALDSLHGCRKPSGSTWNRPPSGGPSTYESPKDRIAKATKIPLGHTGSFFLTLWASISCHKNAILYEFSPLYAKIYP